MGETPGYFIDAESAEAILNKLSMLLNFEINVDKLEERAEETTVVGVGPSKKVFIKDT